MGMRWTVPAGAYSALSRSHQARASAISNERVVAGLPSRWPMKGAPTLPRPRTDPTPDTDATRQNATNREAQSQAGGLLGDEDHPQHLVATRAGVRARVASTSSSLE